ncbi:hypothetical protein NMU47_07480 [Pasteurella multocida]|nr:hypothetical protein [Pasteurella multocida]
MQKQQPYPIHLGIFLMLGLPTWAFSQANLEKSTINKLETILVNESEEKNKFDENLIKTYLSSGSYSYLSQSDISTFRGR